MDLKEFEGKESKEIQEELQKRLDEFKAQVDKMKDLDELNTLEEEVDKEQADFDEYLKDAKYALSEEGVEFEGKKFSRKDIAHKIIYFLNRHEQDFQYCLGLHSLVVLWKGNDLKDISYGAYDSTLRLLGQLKYKGDSEWTDILAINNYLVCAHEPYNRDRSILYYLAEKRNAVVDRIQLCSKVESAPQEAAE